MARDARKGGSTATSKPKPQISKPKPKGGSKPGGTDRSGELPKRGS